VAQEFPMILPMGDLYRDYLRDESRVAGRADSLSFPKNEREIQDILHELQASGCPVTVQGSRTGLTAAAVPCGGHIMNLSGMNRIRGIRVDARGLFCLRVEPGITLLDLKRQISGRSFDTAAWDDEAKAAFLQYLHAPEQFFAPDPTETSASLGGMAACCASGARSFYYGSTRHHISALRVVLSDGQTLSIRRGSLFADDRTLVLPTVQNRSIQLQLPSIQMPPVKSAAGYYVKSGMDAIDLFIGSEGTLGVISEIELALLPLPPVIWGAVFFFGDDEAAVDFVSSVRSGSEGAVIALEYFDEHILDILSSQKARNPAFADLPGPGPAAGCAIYAEFKGNDEDETSDTLSWLGELLNRSGGRDEDAWLAISRADKDKLARFRHAAPEAVNLIIDERRRGCPSITKLSTDMSVPDSRLKDVLALYKSSLQESGLEHAIWGHIGNNHFHVNILPHNERDFLLGQKLTREWAGQIVRMGGSVSAEHGIGKLKTGLLSSMYGLQQIHEMACLKQSLDPAGILGAGNLFGDRVID
jgi:D-lactate dehydrogenase (cytochrome)